MEEKKRITLLSEQPVQIKAGEGKAFIANQRKECVSFYEQLVFEQKRKQEIEDRVQAYREVKRRLQGSNISEGELLINLQTELEEMQEKVNQNMAVKLYQRTQEIDFDAY